jgi:uncharacterized membrane protein
MRPLFYRQSNQFVSVSPSKLTTKIFFRWFTDNTTPKFLLFSYSKFVLTNHLATNSNSDLIATFCTALGYLLYRPIATFCTALALPFVPPFALFHLHLLH